MGHRKLVAIASAAALALCAEATGLVLVLGSTSSAPQPSVLGGKLVGFDAFPSLAEILYTQAPNGKHGFLCTGTVVSPKLVLTAGHCAQERGQKRPRGPSGFGVFTGDRSSAPGPYPLRVVRVLVYPGYEDAADEAGRDAALLVLRAATQAPPVRLAQASDKPMSMFGSKASIIGWAHGGSGGLSQEIEAETVIGRPEGCGNHGVSPFAAICTGGLRSDHSGTCLGESGGPLLGISAADGHRLQIGIDSEGPVSRETGRCSTTGPSTWTSTIAISSWLRHWITRYAPKR